MNTPSKYQLRLHYREVRSKIPVKEREQAAFAAARIFAHIDVFNQSEHIACYLPNKDEFDPMPILDVIWQAKKQCYLPVLAKSNDKTLVFVPYAYGDALHRNQFSILEPINISHSIPLSELDLVITPLIAFDKQGHRLGTGGGYYDKTFEHQAANKPYMMGLGYAAQEAPHIPADPWDITLKSVITEKGLVKTES